MPKILDSKEIISFTSEEANSAFEYYFDNSDTHQLTLLKFNNNGLDTLLMYVEPKKNNTGSYYLKNGDLVNDKIIYIYKTREQVSDLQNNFGNFL